jgi:hypothetical protein
MSFIHLDLGWVHGVNGQVLGVVRVIEIERDPLSTPITGLMKSAAGQEIIVTQQYLNSVNGSNVNRITSLNRNSFSGADYFLSGGVSMELPRPDLFGNNWGGGLIGVADKLLKAPAGLLILFPDDKGLKSEYLSDLSFLAKTGFSYSLQMRPRYQWDKNFLTAFAFASVLPNPLGGGTTLLNLYAVQLYAVTGSNSYVRMVNVTGAWQEIPKDGNTYGAPIDYSVFVEEPKESTKVVSMLVESRGYPVSSAIVDFNTTNPSNISIQGVKIQTGGVIRRCSVLNPSCQEMTQCQITALQADSLAGQCQSGQK